MRDLKVPYALDSKGEVIAALTAPHGEPYRCLECGQRLALRRRQGQRPHFTHLPDALVVCSGESATHLAAKHLLKAQLEQELAEAGEVLYHLPCPGVEGKCQDHTVHTHSLPVTSWDTVELEVGYLTYRLDVAVMSGSTPVIGFEVFFRHEVPEIKAEALELPWLELLAEDILAYRPRVPHRSLVKPYRCDSCKRKAERLRLRKKDDHMRDEIQAEFVAEQTRVKSAWNVVLSKARGALLNT